MASELQARAQRFVNLPVPADLDYATGSIAERIIAHYAAEGRLDADSEWVELLELAVMEATAAADRATGTAGEYLRESAELLAAISEAD